MSLDYSDIPFEIWCDTVEDEGLTTEDLRTLFNRHTCEESHYHSEEYGCSYGCLDNHGCGYELVYGYGYGYGYKVEYGNGQERGYEYGNGDYVLGNGCDYGDEDEE